MNTVEKLEHPDRVLELAPKQTLCKMGLLPGMVFADIGAGSGLFTLPAAQITQNTVYAVDSSNAMRNVLAEKTKQFKNSIKITDHIKNVPTGCCDMVFMCTVLHEIPSPTLFIQEVKRIGKPNSLFGLIEFYKRKTPMGPPQEKRIGEKEAEQWMNQSGYLLKEHFSLGENFYGMVFDRLP